MEAFPSDVGGLVTTLKGYWGFVCALGIGGPLVALAAALALDIQLISESAFVPEEGLGPRTWPHFMLLGCIASAVTMCAMRGWRSWKARTGVLAGQAAGDHPPAAGAGAVAALQSQYDNRKMMLGLLGVVLYGVAISYIGFAFATVALLVYWLLIGGMRKPLTIALTAVLGPVALLYLFVKVAYTPLPRGEGIFDTMTILLYRLLGIF